MVEGQSGRARGAGRGGGGSASFLFLLCSALLCDAMRRGAIARNSFSSLKSTAQPSSSFFIPPKHLMILPHPSSSLPSTSHRPPKQSVLTPERPDSTHSSARCSRLQALLQPTLFPELARKVHTALPCRELCQRGGRRGFQQFLLALSHLGRGLSKVLGPHLRNLIRVRHRAVSTPAQP